MKNTPKTEEQIQEAIKELKALAMKHYNDGGDFMIECWDTKTWKEFIEQCDMFCRPYDTCLLEVMGILDDRRKDIEATAF